MVAGFLCRIAKEKFPCPRASAYMVSKSMDTELTEFIRRQDTGGLMYPCDQLVSVVVTAARLFEEYWPTIKEWKNCALSLETAFIQPIRSSKLISCGCEDGCHTRRLQKLIVKHLVQILLHNKSKMLSDAEDKPNCRNKPLCRKVLKLS